MSDDELLERITVNPAVMAGKPVIKGTRLTVEYILNLLAHGVSITYGNATKAAHASPSASLSRPTACDSANAGVRGRRESQGNVSDPSLVAWTSWIPPLCAAQYERLHQKPVSATFIPAVWSF